MDEYDVLLRNGEDNQQIDVYIRLGITKIYDIDTVNQRFQAELIIESKWHESRVKTPNDDVNKLVSLWKPDLYIENAINDPKEEITHKIVWDEEKKCLMMSEIRRVKGLFWENLELENFPLDVQDLTIVVARLVLIDDF